MTNEIVAQLRQSKKYRDLCDATLLRLADWALARYPNVKTATKAAKRKLHQVYGAYVGTSHVERIDRLLDGLDINDPKPVCATILREHVSSSERLDFLADVFPALWKITGRPTSVMDLACGLNPFAWPWMDLEGVRYDACDINGQLIGCMQRFFKQMHIRGTVSCNDVLVSVPAEKPDVVLLLKTVPCLEQQKKGVGVRILQALFAPYVVISFPTQSLGGNNKGMAEHYDGLVREMAHAGNRQIHTVSFPNETFYVLTRL
jgi:16S rRNA (guanine(1405)-N(7))-methyltransferase